MADYDSYNTNPVDTTEEPEGPSLKSVKNIKDFGECKKYWNYKGDDMLLHYDASPKGGVFMKDKEGIIPQATKDLVKKVAGKLVKGQISDMSTISQPSYLHHYISLQALHKNDMSFCKELKKAANMGDAI